MSVPFTKTGMKASLPGSRSCSCSMALAARGNSDTTTSYRSSHRTIPGSRMCPPSVVRGTMKNGRVKSAGGMNGTNAVGYLCGHPEMIEHGKGILKRRGFPKEALKEEVYWIPGKETAG